MYTIKTPYIIPYLFKDFIWKVHTPQKEVFLTFDDGPTEGVTDQVLDLLKVYHAKATFFCVGEQIEKNPQLFKRIVKEGHTIGNHTYSHLHGWYTPPNLYLEEIEKTSQLIEKLVGFRPVYFRPPYGKLSPSTKNKILKNYQIIMWDILSGDFDKNMSVEDCITNVLSTYQKGSIIVLHDSQKSGKKLLQILPDLLAFFHNNQFKMSNLPNTNLLKNEFFSLNFNFPLFSFINISRQNSVNN